MQGFELQHVAIHGHQIAFRTGGSGPVLLLVHGMASSSATSLSVLPALAEHFTVVAPDLLGHGASDEADGYRCGLHDAVVLGAHGVEQHDAPPAAGVVPAANLTGASFTGADLDTILAGAIWSNTTCPNGMVQSTPCDSII